MRWLHCSDFHVGKDRTAQERLISRIVEHVGEQREKGFTPDFVFITGDIANRGLKSEYAEFRQSFLTPLRNVLGGAAWPGRILAVPGNHDADRGRNAAFDRRPCLASGGRFFDVSKQGKSERDILLPRFKAYRQGAVADISGDWVSGVEGAFAEQMNVRGLAVGVVGLNTAWLSKDDSDRHHLTPGIQLAEAALDKVKESSVCFVLGHHPISWWDEEQATRLRALFGRQNVIYLHGHMHQADGSKEDGAGKDFLAFQAGAAFQARDGEPWRNGLMWGELDVGNEQVRLSPRFWNPKNYDWPVETGRFPENRRVNHTDWWAYPLTIKKLDRNPQPLTNRTVPEGWQALSLDELKTHTSNVSADHAGRFFDGAEPDWTIALSSKIPRRPIVAKLSEALLSPAQTLPVTILLTGPGGEGKSVALRQTIVSVLEAAPKVKVLWHLDETKPLTPDALSRLPDGEWIIATDAADLVANSLFSAVAYAARARPVELKFLMCARDTDWRAAGAERLDWARYSDFRVSGMSGLTLEEAELIVAAWALWEQRLAAPIGEQGRILFDASRNEAVVSEGSLLGAVLTVRHGPSLQGHVARLLDRLGGYKVPSGGSLYDAFVFIAIMHAEGLDFLSRPVLAKAMNCDLREFPRTIVLPLAKEAAASGGTLMQTRHRYIARAAVSIMLHENGEDLADRLVQLARAAKRARFEGTFVPELHRWDYELSDHFIPSAPETAVRIASALFELEPRESKRAVHLARTFREVGEAGEGAAVLAGFEGDVGSNRFFWQEWATCAGRTGDHSTHALLAGWALSDQSAPVPPNIDNALRCLTALCVAFANLYEQYPDPRFVSGRSGASYLGLSLPIQTPESANFLQHKNQAGVMGAGSSGVEQALSELSSAVIAAWEVSGKPPAILSRIADPTTITYEALGRLIPR